MLKKMCNKCNSINLFQKSIDTTRKSDKEESVDLSEIPLTEGYKEEVKEEKGLKMLTPNKLLTRLPILLAQINSRINSKKFKNETRQILYLLYQHNKITKKVCKNLIKHYNNGRKYHCDKRSQYFLF